MRNKKLYILRMRWNSKNNYNYNNNNKKRIKLLERVSSKQNEQVCIQIMYCREPSGCRVYCEHYSRVYQGNEDGADIDCIWLKAKRKELY